ncbi:MAG: hypothetical protein A3F90_00040 [Deltaproteobacteria bacterium RIFCSPLOWO2_12_FULL_60_19]|nr:MAG: hypothetical protein A3F90_00040 [Deltaproteobacteria bacterium RIFCSPLOWO2_12_FULL_60_19]
MRAEAVEAVVQGLKQAGVDFISLLPDSDFSELQRRVGDDRGFAYVPVSSEAIGVGVCAGAWLGGKKPALLVPTSGFLVAVWPLTSLCMAWGLPLLLLIPYRGDIGDAFWLMGPYKDTTEPLLSVLHIPYVVVLNNLAVGWIEGNTVFRERGRRGHGDLATAAFRVQKTIERQSKGVARCLQESTIVSPSSNFFKKRDITTRLPDL